MAERLQQALPNAVTSMNGFVFEECNFSYPIHQTPSNNGSNQNYSASTLPTSGILYGNPISSQTQGNLKINTFNNIFGDFNSSNEPNFFMNEFQQEIPSPRNDYNCVIKKELSFCEINDQQIFNNHQNYDFFNDKAQNNYHTNNNMFNFQNSLPTNNQFMNSQSKHQLNNNQSGNSKNINNQLNNNQGEKNIPFLIDCSPSINCFTQGINNNNNIVEQQFQQQQQQSHLLSSLNSNPYNQSIFPEIPQLVQSDSIVDGIQCEIPLSFFQDIQFERSKIQQSRFVDSGKSQQFENSFGIPTFQQQQSQSSQQCMMQNSQNQNQLYNIFKQHHQDHSFFNPLDQLQHHNEDVVQQISAKKEEDTIIFFAENVKSDDVYNLTIRQWQDDDQNEDGKIFEQGNYRENSTRSQTFCSLNGQLNLQSISNIESSYVNQTSNNDDQSSYYSYTPNKTKRIQKKKEKSDKKYQNILSLPIKTERVVEDKEDRKRSKKTLYYKGSDGTQKKFARITKSMIRPVCNAVCKHLKNFGAIIDKIDWLNQLRSFLLQNNKFIPIAVDFFENHFENYVNNSPKLIEKQEYLLFKENWIRGVSDPENFKGLKQIN